MVYLPPKPTSGSFPPKRRTENIKSILGESISWGEPCLEGDMRCPVAAIGSPIGPSHRQIGRLRPHPAVRGCGFPRVARGSGCRSSLPVERRFQAGFRGAFGVDVIFRLGFAGHLAVDVMGHFLADGFQRFQIGSN